MSEKVRCGGVRVGIEEILWHLYAKIYFVLVDARLNGHCPLCFYQTIKPHMCNQPLILLFYIYGPCTGGKDGKKWLFFGDVNLCGTGGYARFTRIPSQSPFPIITTCGGCLKSVPPPVRVRI